MREVRAASDASDGFAELNAFASQVRARPPDPHDVAEEQRMRRPTVGTSRRASSW
jgi:hypothetical protein